MGKTTDGLKIIDDMVGDYYLCFVFQYNPKK